MTYLQDNCFSDDVDKEEIARLIAGSGMEHVLGVKHKLEIIISKAASYAFSKGKERIGRYPAAVMVSKTSGGKE